jgi:hypothetical protein
MGTVFTFLGIALASSILLLLYRPDSRRYYEYKSRFGS